MIILVKSSQDFAQLNGRVPASELRMVWGDPAEMVREEPAIDLFTVWEEPAVVTRKSEMYYHGTTLWMKRKGY